MPVRYHCGLIVSGGVLSLPRLPVWVLPGCAGPCFGVLLRRISVLTIKKTASWSRLKTTFKSDSNLRSHGVGAARSPDTLCVYAQTVYARASFTPVSPDNRCNPTSTLTLSGSPGQDKKRGPLMPCYTMHENHRTFDAHWCVYSF